MDVTAGQSGTLPLTGERTVPGIPVENYWFRRHEAAYLALEPFAVGAMVLEAGCGEGYGAALLANRARTVVGLDYDHLTVAHVGGRYRGQVRAVRGDLQHLPVRSGTVEVVACLQVIEHLHDQPGFVVECARVLRPAGTLLMTTPNRLTFSPGRDAPLNPFHTRELAAQEMADLLATRFEVARMWGLSHGRRLRRWERRHGSLVEQQTSGAPSSWSAALAGFVSTVRARDFVVGPHRVDDSLDLVAVAVRR